MGISQKFVFNNKRVFIGSYSIVGPKEGKGNFGPYFNYVMKDDSFGEDSYEKAEKKMLESAIVGAIEDAKLKPKDMPQETLMFHFWVCLELVLRWLKAWL